MKVGWASSSLMWCMTCRANPVAAPAESQPANKSANVKPPIKPTTC